MMTIKQILSSGEEFVYPSTHVNYVPQGSTGYAGVDVPPTTLWRYDAEGSAIPMTEGSLFVMNEHGKTVARYSLYGEFPLGEPVKPKGAKL